MPTKTPHRSRRVCEVVGTPARRVRNRCKLGDAIHNFGTRGFRGHTTNIGLGVPVRETAPRNADQFPPPIPRANLPGDADGSLPKVFAIDTTTPASQSPGSTIHIQNTIPGEAARTEAKQVHSRFRFRLGFTNGFPQRRFPMLWQVRQPEIPPKALPYRKPLRGPRSSNITPPTTTSHRPRCI